MSAATVHARSPEYPLDDLRIEATPLGRGGAAIVSRCVTPDHQHVVVKLYNEQTRPKLIAPAIRELVALPAQLPSGDGNRLRELCAWPLATVIEDGSVVGVIMPEAPSAFFYTRNAQPAPRHFTRLAVQKEFAERKDHQYFDFPHKIARLGRLLSDLEFLHANGVVVGDLQPHNILTTAAVPVDSVSTTTQNYVLDCDSFIVRGVSAMPQLDPLSWRPPWEPEGFSETTDLFKFALLSVRCVAEDLAVTGIAFDRFGEIMHSADCEILRALLNSAQPGIRASDLASMARAWQSMVRPNGALFRRTDRTPREAWSSDAREQHLRALDPGPRKPATPPTMPARPRTQRTPDSGRHPDYRISVGIAAALILFSIIVVTLLILNS